MSVMKSQIWLQCNISITSSNVILQKKDLFSCANNLTYKEITMLYLSVAYMQHDFSVILQKKVSKRANKFSSARGPKSIAKYQLTFEI